MMESAIPAGTRRHYYDYMIANRVPITLITRSSEKLIAHSARVQIDKPMSSPSSVVLRG